MGEGAPFGDVAVPAFVTPTDDPTVKFKTCYAMHGTSGAEEPTWSDDGSTTVIDNDLQWGPALFDAAGWQALTRNGSAHPAWNWRFAQQNWEARP